MIFLCGKTPVSFESSERDKINQASRQFILYIYIDFYRYSIPHRDCTLERGRKRVEKRVKKTPSRIFHYDERDDAASSCAKHGAPLSYVKNSNDKH